MAKYEIIVIDNVDETEQSIGFKSMAKFIEACTKVNALCKKGSGKAIGRMDVIEGDNGEIVLTVLIVARQ